MANNEAKRKAIRIGIALVVMTCMLGVAFFVLKILIAGDAGKRKRVVQKVTLVKPPPPPPKPKEKPPEPEVKKKEELPQPEQEELPPEDMDDSMDDEAPPGEDLGLDAEGSGAGDAFGLKGNKGGRSLIGGGGGGRNLLKRYSWYTGILQDEIRKKVNKSLEDRDDVPGGEYLMVLRIKLDEVGNIVSLSVYQSSGKQQVDTFVEEAVTGLKISEAPPVKMPKAMKLKIKFKS